MPLPDDDDATPTPGQIAAARALRQGAEADRRDAEPDRGHRRHAEALAAVLGGLESLSDFVADARLGQLLSHVLDKASTLMFFRQRVLADPGEEADLCYKLSIVGKDGRTVHVERATPTACLQTLLDCEPAKTCTSCREPLPLGAFTLDPSRPDGRSRRCRPCERRRCARAMRARRARKKGELQVMGATEGEQTSAATMV